MRDGYLVGLGAAMACVVDALANLQWVSALLMGLLGAWFWSVVKRLEVKR